MDPVPVIVIAGVVFAYALMARTFERSILTAPMIFAAAGFVIGPMCLNFFDVGIDKPIVHLLVEITLVLILFNDASRIRFSQLRQGFTLPGRLLLIGLPLTIVLGAVAALLVFPEMSWVAVALLAVMLAPTDAALGQAVVTIKRIPIRIRQALNVESGLNDGIAVPIFTAIFIIAGAASHSAEAASDGGEGIGAVLTFAVKQLTLGPLAGILIAWPTGWLIERSVAKQTSTTVAVQIAGLAIAIGAFAFATIIGGNGLIAAFVAGLVIGNTTRNTCKLLLEFAEDEGQLLVLITFLVFGAVMLPVALKHATLPMVIYAVLSLTIVRMIPVFLSLIGSGLKMPTNLFLGWFGPRGLATVLFALIVHEAHDMPASEEVFTIASLVIAMSIVAHGVTAVPMAGWYGRWHERLRANTPEAAECESTPPLPTRFTAKADIVTMENS